MVTQFTLINARGTEVRAIEYGAIITSIRTADRGGAARNIALGCDSIDGYRADRRYMGAIVGRYANRIANGRFTIDGQMHQLSVNEGHHHLHGGKDGFNRALWTGTPMPHRNGVVFTRTSADGEQGYPGAVEVSVDYELTDADELILKYHATTDRATHINLTQHTYFNLTGDASHDIRDHQVTINADSYTPVDAMRIPTGAIAPVAGTPLDFRDAKAIGNRSYDDNFVLNQVGDDLGLAARVFEPVSGRTLTVSTTEPGLQFYATRRGFCLETQHFPDSPNRPEFPSTLLRPTDRYRSTTVFAFGVAPATPR
jgi:aldose 1-epimerase